MRSLVGWIRHIISVFEGYRVLAASVAVFTCLSVFPNYAMAQTSAEQDCEQLKEQIKKLQAALVDLSTELPKLQDAVDEVDKAVQKQDQYLKDHPIGVWLYGRDKWNETHRKLTSTRDKLKNRVEDLKLTIQALKDTIADLLNQLGDCGKKKAGNAPTPAPTQTPVEHALVPPTGQQQPTLAALASTGRIKIDTAGTGETIGHIADLKVQNLTDQPLNCSVPPMILESGSGKNQHYACPRGQNVDLGPHEQKTVPMDGVCINRNKPPVGKGVTGDLVVNTGDPNVPQNPDSHIPANRARDLLRICTAKYDAADKLQEDGALKDLPYKDKQKQKDIVTQWSTWCDPRISKLTGAPPATKDDLKKVVYKQIDEKGPMTPETKKKVDQGIDTIFEKIELTTAKAKDLEKPDQ